MMMIKKKISPYECAFALTLFVVAFCIVWRMCYCAGTDYYVHMNMAAIIRQKVPYNVSYPMWHFLVWGLAHILGSSETALHISCAFISAGVTAATYLIICHLLRDKIQYYEIISFSLCFVTAIFLPFYNERIYLGQGSPVIWHNPTNLMVKPFAIIIFFLVADMISKIEKGKIPKNKDYIWLSVLAFFSVLAKPSFFQGFVPALGIYILILLVRAKFHTFGQYFKICTMFIPAFLVIIAQFFVSFYTGTGEGIGFGLFAISKSPNIVISLFLVLCFPLSYLLCFWKKAQNKTTIQLSWIFWLISWLEYVSLYEKGSRMYDGNFGWAVELSYSLLFIVATKEYFGTIKRGHDAKSLRKTGYIPLIAFLLHFFSGIIYAIQMLVGFNDWWL